MKKSICIIGLISCLFTVLPAFADLKDLDFIKDKFDINQKNHVERDYEGINLSNKNLAGFNFTGAELDKVNFENSDLTGANFTDAEVEQANFKNANLSGANFTNADLEEADLTGATIKGTTFKNAELEYTIWIDGKTCAADSVGSCW